MSFPEGLENTPYTPIPRIARILVPRKNCVTRNLR